MSFSSTLAELLIAMWMNGWFSSQSSYGRGRFDAGDGGYGPVTSVTWLALAVGQDEKKDRSFKTGL